MKYFIITLLFTCTIVTASQDKKIQLENIKIQKDGDRIIASAQEKGTQKKFSFEKDTKNKTSYCFYMKPASNEQTPGFDTQGIIYEDMTEKRPDLRSAFERKIDEFQKNQAKPSLRNTETKSLKNQRTKRLPLIRRASSVFTRRK